MGIFKTDVIDRDPHARDLQLVKDTALLEPHMLLKVEAIIADAATAGHRLIVLETYRSQARQAQLFAEGKSKLQHVGTHGYGLACDMAFLGADGQVNWQADYSVLGHIARSHNLIWGGDWGRPDLEHSFRDMDHVQWCSVHDQAALFAGAWYPDANYNPYEHL